MMIIEVTAGIEMIVGEIIAIETATIAIETATIAIETATTGTTAAIEIATEMTLDATAIGIPMVGGTCGIIVETFGLGAMPGGSFGF